MDFDFRSTADWVPGMLWTTLPTGEADFFSRRWYDYTGLSTAEALRNGWLSATHPDDAERVTHALNQSISSGTSYNVHQRVRGTNGKYRWFETLLEAQKDDFGSIVRWCGLQTDIEGQRQAEQELLANMLDFRSVIDSIPALVSIMTPEGETELLNQQVLNYFGKTPAELKDWAISDAVHPDDLPRVIEKFAIAIKTGGLYDVEHRCRRADGAYRWFQVQALPIRDKAGNIVRWYCLLVDIDDRKRAEDVVRGSERALTDIINAIPVMAWSALTTGAGDFFNRHYVEFVGVPQDDLKGLAWTTAVHPDDLDDVIAVWQGMLEDDAGGECEARMRRHDGQYRWFLFRTNPLRDEFGKTVKWYGTNVDIDDRKRAETLQAELARVSRANSIGALTASIAHEVSQPLAGIITNAGTCLRMLANSPPRIEGAFETARLIIRDGNRAAEVVSRLRQLFAKTDELIIAIDLHAAAREIIALASRELQTKRVHVVERFDETIPPVLGDRVQVQQVILNLLLNATEAMEGIDERPRRIVVSTRMVGASQVLFCVEDNGVGIDAVVAENLFQPFATTKEGGMGIGLFVSRSIIEKHHGRLWCESNKAGGASFQFTLDAAPIF